ncbi:hypothetical protein ACTFIZ_007904 [Dictyostelium cf. discoideum]
MAKQRKSDWDYDTAIKMFEDCEILEKIGLHKNQKDNSKLNLALGNSKNHDLNVGTSKYLEGQFQNKKKISIPPLSHSKLKAPSQRKSIKTSPSISGGSDQSYDESDHESEEVESDNEFVNNLQYQFDDSQNEETFFPYNSDSGLQSYVTPTKNKTQLSQDTTKIMLDGYRISTTKLKDKIKSLEKEIEVLESKGIYNSKIIDRLGTGSRVFSSGSCVVKVDSSNNFAFFVSPVSSGEIKYTIEQEDESFEYYKVIVDETENDKSYQQIYLLKKCVDYGPPSIVFYGKKKLFK